MIVDHRRNRIAGAAALSVLALLVLMVCAVPASAATFSNSSAITINDYLGGCSAGPDSAQATPYPSQIQVSGQQGTVSDVNATINGFTHTYPADVRMLLVGPHGQTTDLLDEVGSGTDVSGLTVTLDDAAATTAPDPLTSGTFKPTQEGSGCGLGPASDFPSPAPANPYATDLSGFNGTDPNGAWSLYVVDDSSSDSGSIDGGWSLDITAPAATTPSKTEDPKCAKLRKKLKHQKQHLARTGTDKKRSMVEANIEDTNKRLQRLGC
jgi:subtilisin-like proprotein convertase family protein